MRTYTNSHFFDPAKPDRRSVRRTDIAVSLSRIPRYLGHTLRPMYPYSVAEHSLRMMDMAAPDVKPYALLHDAAEAYLGDMTTPVKTALAERAPCAARFFEDLEERWLDAIHDFFGLRYREDHREEVKRLDGIMLVTEMRDLTRAPMDHPALVGLTPAGEKIVPWPPHLAASRFYAEITKL